MTNLPQWVAQGHFVLRAPLLEQELLEAWPHTVHEARRYLDALVQRPDVLEAISVAAPAVIEGLPLWRDSPDSERGRKLERALMSYLQRLASRATPFGLFASVSLGRVVAATNLELEPVEACRRVTRVDMGVLFQLCETLLKRPEVRQRVRYRPNETVLAVGDRLHFVQGHQDGERRLYELSSTSALEPLVALLDFANPGRTRDELIAELTRTVGAPGEEIVPFVDQVIDEQLVLPDLRPLLTGSEALSELAQQVDRLGLGDDPGHALRRLLESIGELDRQAPGTGLDKHRALTKQVQALGVKAEPGRALQVDLFRPVRRAELSTGLVQGLLKVVQRLAAVFGSDVDPLAAFKSAFEKRWESAEVPLLAALDEEAGVGLLQAASSADNPLLKGLPLGNNEQYRPPGVRPAVAGFLAEVLWRGQRSKTGCVELIDAELEHLSASHLLPESFSVMVNLFAPAALAQGEIHSAGGASSENLNGRFCWLDPGLEAAVKGALAAEEALRPDCIFVEVVHSPEGRVGNVIARPCLRSFELPILSRSGAAPDKQLALSDLTVSVREGRIVLRSRSLGKEVVPRLTNAHNFTTGLPVYRFLGGLQSHRTMVWSWGAYGAFPALPRVTYRKWVISPAHWRLPANTLSTVTSPEALSELAAALRWPRRLLAVDYDNTLPLDLENPLSVRTFLDTYGSRSDVLLREDLQGLWGSAVRSDRGSLANEVVISFRAQQRLVPPAPRSDRAAIPRRFAPGEEWLFMRAKTAVASADALLLSAVAPLVKKERQSGDLTRWFFIRYGDPDHHLRLRFRGDPRYLREHLLPELQRALADARGAGLCSEETWSTYVREVERYGGPHTIESAEAMFEVDSDAVLALLELAPGKPGLDVRWRWALVAVSDIHQALQLSDPRKMMALKEWRGSLFHEFGAADTLEDALSKKARSLRTEVDQLVGKKGSGPPLELGWPVLQQRAKGLAHHATALIEGDRNSSLTAPLHSIAGALSHMSCNRLLRSGQRANELVIYDLLLRHLQSKMGRERKGGSASEAP